ncbi:LytR/AlgR family response regulator transcription factor [Flagellimonas nanhaiensis]|uniref:LytR/AlgR family response regulator transcription factor n=1 Tax=Flagellimonas nanhaiensis TaxID=2292706 RepID=UPI0015F25F26|nr:LytTR family DNA-binding domain-containing protein [Allomuricauda nanhaiensis]
MFRRPYIGLITFTITFLNFLITYNLRNVETTYVAYFGVDLIITYLTIIFYALGIRVLDKKVPLEEDFLKRIMYQFTLHTISVVIFNILLNELFDNIFFGGGLLSLSFGYYTQDVPLAVVFVLLFHSIYFALYLVSERGKKQQMNLSNKRIKVLDGNANIFISFDEILCIYSEYGGTFVITNDLNKYGTEKTLKDFEEVLPHNFYRANRQIIISLSAIDGYQSSTYGKIEVMLKPLKPLQMPETIFISRDKASSFRSWFRRANNIQ